MVLKPSWQTKRVTLSVTWAVATSDAPYSVVVSLWTTDGIPIGFWRVFRAISFSRRAQPKKDQGIKW